MLASRYQLTNGCAMRRCSTPIIAIAGKAAKGRPGLSPTGTRQDAHREKDLKVNEGLVALAFDCRDHLVQLARLADRFADQKPQLADLCLVRMSGLFPKHSVMTIDRTDFQVYRRNKRETILLLCPPVC
jgi:hypothetical protein